MRTTTLAAMSMAAWLWAVDVQGAEVTQESLAAVRQKVSAGEAALVDVREKSEWDAGHVRGAVFLPLSRVKSGVTAESLRQVLPRDKVLYTYCVVGKRAMTVAETLERHGYEVRTLRPGYRELVAAGFEADGP